jgi:hypothetical protein
MFNQSLWTVPNIMEHGTRVPFVVTSILVGFVTYMIVFNLDNVANRGRRFYQPFKSKVVGRTVADQETSAKKDQSSDSAVRQKETTESKWKTRAERFQSTFDPKRGEGKPSDWWILMYVWRSPLHPLSW